MAGGEQLDAALARAVDARADALAELTTALVRERSTAGQEHGAQAVVRRRLERLGLDVRDVPLDAAGARADPHGGYPAFADDGRTSLVAQVGEARAGEASLHLSGH